MHGNLQRRGNEHARIYGSPGERPKLAGLMRAIWPLFVTVGLTGYLLRAALPVPEINRTAAGFLLLMLGAGLAAVAGASRARLADFLKGARGEERVARELAFLPAAFSVFHGLPLGSCGWRKGSDDLDHLVLGPTGIFVVETKNWAGKATLDDGRVLYDGRLPDRPPLEQVKAAAHGLEALLGERGIPLTPVLCFAADSLAEDRQGAAGVVVCNRRALLSVIRDTAERPLASGVIERIEARLRALM